MNQAACIVAISMFVTGCAFDDNSGLSVAPGSYAALDEAAQLGKLGAFYLESAEFAAAEPLLVRALALRESVLGTMHPEVAHALRDLAELHRVREEYGIAAPLLIRALDIHDRAQETDPAELVATLYSLAETYRLQAEFDSAAPLHARALDIAEHALGATHPGTAMALTGMAQLHEDLGEYNEAEPLYLRTQSIVENVLGPTHPEVARSLNRLGRFYRLLAEYDKAKALHTRALDIAEAAWGPWHPDVAQSLNDLANIDWYQGEYASAEARHSRALAIHEKVFGPVHSQVAKSLGNLAMVVQDSGEDERAEPLYRRALEICEKVYGPMHTRVANILHNFAGVYWDLGAYVETEGLERRALDIYEKALGPTHDDVAAPTYSLGVIRHVQGDYAAAESLYMHAIDVTEKALGPMHPDLAIFLNSLAWLYREQRMYRKAEPLLMRALDIIEKKLGPSHLGNTSILESLASVHRDQRSFDKAWPLLVRASRIRENVLGPGHPWMVVNLTCLAKFYWVQGAFEKVEPLLARAADIREAQLRVEMPRLSEPRKRALMTYLQAETDSIISLHVHGLPHSQSALELALTTALRRKGRVLDSTVDNTAALRAHLTPRSREQLDELDHLRGELVRQLYTWGASTDRAAIAAVRARIEDVESTLSAASAAFRAQSETVTLPKVRSAIPSNAVLVELMRYHRFDPAEVQPSREERYVAYLLRRSGPPQWVALGEAARIDAQVDAVLAAMDDKVPAPAASAALRRLDALLLAPIRARSSGASHLILAPDGKLNLVPFEALLDAQGRPALDRYLINYVTTGRDLLRLAASREPRSAGVIVAGPDYGPPPPQSSKVSFPPLAEALGEAADLEPYFATTPLTGDKATKTALKTLTGPAILHIATHGFYARRGGARPMPAPGNPSREMFADPSSPLLPPPLPDDPADGLDRAGLAMAGANRGPEGIVTAREIAGFDWWGTQLVVLSACETGVGAVPSGDGVYGMRRALVLAGTASQVVSLWAADDASTRTLMRDYYAELARGTGRAEALRVAKLRLLRQPRYAHPHYWAAFIPTGDWRPLNGDALLQRAAP